MEINKRHLTELIRMERFEDVYTRHKRKELGCAEAADREVEMITRLYEERYRGMSVAHFHDYAVRKHGLSRSYNWTRQTLGRAGQVRPSKRGGPHRLRRPRKPLCARSAKGAWARWRRRALHVPTWKSPGVMSASNPVN